MFNKINYIIKVRRDAKAIKSNIVAMKKMANEAQGASVENIYKNIEKMERTLNELIERARKNATIFSISFI